MENIIQSIKKNWDVILIMCAFLVISSFVFSPELQGKKLSASDAVSWTSGAKEFQDYAAKGENIKWTGRLFSGMPLYTMAGDYGGNHFLGLWSKLASWMPYFLGILFVVMLCSFLSLISLNFNKSAAFIASIGFGLNTWMVASLWASHPTKIQGLGYIFCVVAGFISYMSFQKRWALVLVMFGLSFALAYGHYQIVYYGLIMCVILGFYFLYDSIKTNQFGKFFKNIIPIILAVGLAIASNYSGIFGNKEYSKETMRGGKTELTLPDAKSTSKTGGLDIDYAFAWSSSVTELFSFMLPDAMGGASQYFVKRSESKLAKAVNQNALPMYFGDQPFTGAPNYLGITLFFLFIFSMFYWESKYKLVLFLIWVLSMFMGLGKHFLSFNQILFDYLPMYNKFRTPTMAFSILNIITVIVVAGGLTQLFNKEDDIDKVKQKLKYSVYTLIGLIVMAFFMVSSTGFTSDADQNVFNNQQQLISLAIEDRQSFFNADIIRAILFMLLMGILLFIASKYKSSKKYIIPVLAMAVFFDLSGVYKRYLSNDSFKKVKETKSMIPDEAYNQYMINDKSHFRIVNTTVNPFSDNTDSYRFNSLGGYSPAKLYRYQDLIDVHLSKMNMNVLNMLNTKYFVVANSNSEKIAQTNPNACGNAWFVKEVKFAKDANEEIKSIGESEPKKTAWVDIRYQKENDYTTTTDTSSSIKLTSYHPENMFYESNSNTGGFVVFSEIWYRGNDEWKLFVNGKESSMVRTNYLLRGAYIPKGKNKIEMKYSNPKLDSYVKMTASASYFMGLIGILLIVFSIFKIDVIENLKTKLNL